MTPEQQAQLDANTKAIAAQAKVIATLKKKIKRIAGKSTNSGSRKPSAYLLFVKENMKSAQAEAKEGGGDQQSAMAILGKKWSALTDAEKEDWKSKSAQDSGSVSDSSSTEDIIADH